jgi:hypothetical protein
LPVLPTLLTRSRIAAAAGLVALALASGGCSSSGSSSPAAAPTTGGSQAGGVRPVASTVVLGKVAGTIRKKSWKVFTQHRKHLLTRVGQAVDTWLDGGFVGVDYPRHSFGTAFAAFTTPAKHDARHQRRLMTNWHLRKRIDGVRVKKRKVSVDVLAPRGRPAGATAHVNLVFKTTGQAEKRVTVRGRLFLAPDPQGTWRIFGYDVSKGATG